MAVSIENREPSALTTIGGWRCIEIAEGKGGVGVGFFVEEGLDGFPVAFLGKVGNARVPGE